MKGWNWDTFNEFDCRFQWKEKNHGERKQEAFWCRIPGQRRWQRRYDCHGRWEASRQHGASNRDKAQHSQERGLDSKAVQTEQYQDHAANRRPPVKEGE
jgi:hypothetical protein